MSPNPKKPTRAEIERRDKALVDATRPFCVEDVGRSWRETLITLWVLILLIAVAAVAPQLWIRIPASIVAGLVIVRGFILYHDHQHNALLRFSPLGRALFWVYGMLVLTPPTVWRQTHNYHHAHNSKIVGSHVGSYPILTLELWEKATPRQQLMYKITRHPLNVLFGYFTVFGFGMCVSPFLRRPKGTGTASRRCCSTSRSWSPRACSRAGTSPSSRWCSRSSWPARSAVTSFTPSTTSRA